MKYAILIALSCVLSVLVILQYGFIKAQEKKITEINKQLIHIQTCHEVMESVKRLELWDRESKDCKRELERIDRQSIN